MKKLKDFTSENLDLSQLMNAKEMRDIQGGCENGFFSCYQGLTTDVNDCHNGFWGCVGGMCTDGLGRFVW
ncbi:MAG: hypothetical protein HXX16_12760 [Bacteroidales bacterium]|nr:hypothetical protein [Bacteroidales bacterium]